MFVKFKGLSEEYCKKLDEMEKERERQKKSLESELERMAYEHGIEKPKLLLRDLSGNGIGGCYEATSRTIIMDFERTKDDDSFRGYAMNQERNSQIERHLEEHGKLIQGILIKYGSPLPKEEIDKKVQKAVQGRRELIEKAFKDGVDIGGIMENIKIPIDIAKVEWCNEWCFKFDDGSLYPIHRAE